MRTLEILSAILAEDVMRNGTQINLDPEEIIWPDGSTTKATENLKGPRGGRKRKAIASSKNGVFGKIVNEYGPKNKTRVQPKSTTILVPVQEKNNDAADQDVQEGDIPKKGTKTCKLAQFMFRLFCKISLFHMNVKLFAGKWDFSEQSDLLMVFKTMLLGGLKKDNYKELAKRLNEIGWNRSNDQCRHEVQKFSFRISTPKHPPKVN